MPACPTCRAEAAKPPDNPYAPFCSRRCKLVDLGKWIDEEYRIPDQSPDEDAHRTNGSAR